MTQSDTTTATEEQPAPAPDTGKDAAAEVEKWKALARKHEQAAKDNATAVKRLAEFEDRDKTEQQKTLERAEAAERQLAAVQAEALRGRVALAKGLTPALAARLRGDTEDDMAADADELLALLAPPVVDPGPSALRRPVEHLRAGATPATEVPIPPANASPEALIAAGLIASDASRHHKPR